MVLMRFTSGRVKFLLTRRIICFSFVGWFGLHWGGFKVHHQFMTEADQLPDLYIFLRSSPVQFSVSFIIFCLGVVGVGWMQPKLVHPRLQATDFHVKDWELQRPRRFRPRPYSCPRSVTFLMMIVWSIILWPGSKNVLLQLQSRDDLAYNICWSSSQ